MTHDLQGDGGAKHRFLVDFQIEGSVEVELLGTASDNEVANATRQAVFKQFTSSHSMPWEIQIGMVDGPF